jgi:hypothetical protein
MTRNRKLLIGGLAIAIVGAGAIAASAHRGGGGFGGHHGGGMGPMGFGAVCKGNGAEMADHMLIGLEYKVKPTDAQKPAFEELKAAAKAAAAKAAAGCPPKTERSADGARPAPKAPTERLAMMEAGLTAQLDAIRTVRPAADKFYATLSDDQKKTLTERGRGGWQRGERGEKHGWGHRGREGDEAPRAPDQGAPQKK